MTFTLVIPAYNPEQTLIQLISSLASPLIDRIIVINDGSKAHSQPVFEALSQYPNVVLLEHAINMGKGAALKTAFNYVLVNQIQHSSGVVTADADGQHAPEDILRTGEALINSPEKLILGTRAFKQDVPLRSRFGNVITKHIYHTLIGTRLSDTQTGLRGIPAHFLKECLGIQNNGYAFELEMLILTTQNHMVIEEIKIKTIYENNNASSHFNPLTDSIKIYFVFVRFISLSLITAALDFIIFSIAYLLCNKIFLSVAAGRLIAGIFNFTCNKHLVFKSKNIMLPELVKYVALVILMMCLTYGMVTSTVIFLHLNIFFSKLLAEILLFLMSFSVQKTLVFSPKRNMKRINKTTNWDDYYNKPFKTASFTRKMTERKLIALIKTQFKPTDRFKLCELGGANSCFYNAIRSSFPNVDYTIIDNNKTGLDAFEKRLPNEENVTLRNQDILELKAGFAQADVVYSVGLIEHFTPEQTAKAIRSHFTCAKKNGLVIITFPTPTLLYLLLRSVITFVGLWIFHDERPLPMKAVLAEMERYGQVSTQLINWGTLLTQGIIAVRPCLAPEASSAITPQAV